MSYRPSQIDMCYRSSIPITADAIGAGAAADMDRQFRKLWPISDRLRPLRPDTRA